MDFLKRGNTSISSVEQERSSIFTTPSDASKNEVTPPLNYWTPDRIKGYAQTLKDSGQSEENIKFGVDFLKKDNPYFSTV